MDPGPREAHRAVAPAGRRRAVEPRRRRRARGDGGDDRARVVVVLHVDQGRARGDERLQGGVVGAPVAREAQGAGLATERRLVEAREEPRGGLELVRRLAVGIAGEARVAAAEAGDERLDRAQRVAHEDDGLIREAHGAGARRRAAAPARRAARARVAPAGRRPAAPAAAHGRRPLLAAGAPGLREDELRVPRVAERARAERVRRVPGERRQVEQRVEPGDDAVGARRRLVRDVEAQGAEPARRRDGAAAHGPEDRDFHRAAVVGRLPRQERDEDDHVERRGHAEPHRRRPAARAAAAAAPPRRRRPRRDARRLAPAEERRAAHVGRPGHALRRVVRRRRRRRELDHGRRAARVAELAAHAIGRRAARKRIFTELDLQRYPSSPSRRSRGRRRRRRRCPRRSPGGACSSAGPAAAAVSAPRGASRRRGASRPRA